MQPLEFRIALLSALLLAAGSASAIEPPRVMFVSATDVQPVIIDQQGHEVPAKKGVVIEPGFTVKVPEGATLQIMTAEKGILAVRPNSLLKLEGLGEGPRPYMLKLDSGGLRVANSDKNPHKYEIQTPNARIKFEKGDNEAFYLQNGKLKDGRWGTFVRGLKDDDVVLSTPTGDVKVPKSDIGFVSGTGADKPLLLARVDASGKSVGNPVSYVPGAKEIGTTEMVQNFQALGDKSVTTTDLTTGARTITVVKSDPVTLPVITPVKLVTTIDPSPVIAPASAVVGGLDKIVIAPALKDVAAAPAVQNPTPPTLATATDSLGNKTPAIVQANGTVIIPSTSQNQVLTIPSSVINKTTTATTTTPKITTILRIK